MFNSTNIIFKNGKTLHFILNKSANRFLHSNLNILKQSKKFNVITKENASDSLISSHFSLFLRRNRFFNRKTAPKDAQKIKTKIKISEIKRLLSLAKPDRFKLAGKNIINVLLVHIYICIYFFFPINIGAMILLLISSGVTMSVPFFIGKLIDFIQTNDKELLKERLKYITLIMLGVFVIGALANFGRVYIIQSTSQRIVMRLRENLFRSIMNQEMAFFDNNKTGELINRLSSDAEIVGMSISQNLSDGLRSTIQAAGGIGMMIYVSPFLAAIGLSVVPAVTIFAISFGRYIKKLSKQVQDVLAEATEVSLEFYFIKVKF